jgi:hypothetical protein
VRTVTRVDRQSAIDRERLIGDPFNRLPDECSRWEYQLKFDGYRAIAFKTGGKIHLRSRNDNDFSIRYSNVVKGLAKLPDETVIDGEVIALDDDGRPSFNVLPNHGASRAPVLYFVFDVMVLPGRDLMREPLEPAPRASKRPRGTAAGSPGSENGSSVNQAPLMFPIVSLQARVDRRIPLLFGAVDGVVRMEHPRVVEENVETAAEGAQSFRHHAFAIARKPDVGPEEDRRAADRPDLRDHVSTTRLVTAGHHHPGAFLREEESRCLANA